ncbi:hypothetical protein G3580_09115 [Nitrogeniibacter mangrovi]|uniref:POTRA domain-containing protein n=1 Tax=Nitrogeniibacter mangrovi TaxID=2016596 RepID=A0A6C1B2J7_9RHOO|nr:hypothetical protein [Nitrogeniibacter mangrovi]QID17787.1 hypothetical protein G3580_09115 [Nitrogeniibacter mangrovi]
MSPIVTHRAATLAIVLALGGMSLGAHADAAHLRSVKLAPKAARAAPPPPVRPYAIDGESFFYGGRKIVVEGLEMPRPGSELAKQRLQRILDSGELSIAPVGEPVHGAVRAHVSVDGQLISE